MSNVEELVEAGVTKRMATLRASEARFAEIQRGKLESIVSRNADTEFGSAHGFDRIGSYDDYRRAVPPSTALDYDEAWKRIAKGERNLLFADPVHAFGLSSGTTGEAKTIPLTKALLRGHKRAVGNTTASYMAHTGDYSLLRGYALQVAAPANVRRIDDIPVGYITGVIGAARTYPFHNIGIPTQEVLDLMDWDEKNKIIAERYADHEVSMIFGVPLYILALLRRLDRVWPDLRLVTTSGTALSGLRGVFEELCPGASFLEMYLATEGAIAFQLADDPDGLVPMVDDIFLEFVPEEDWGATSPPRLPLWEVETGVRYVPLITTPSGLYAYSCGDTVRFSRVDPPRLLVEGRQGNVLNHFAEKLSGEHVEMAIREAAYQVEGFTVCPAERDARHEWVIEFRGSPPADAPEHIDAIVGRLNPSYRLMRAGEEGLLRMPLVTTVKEGTFAAALRRRPGQGKILRVYQDRKVRDELVALSKA